MTTNKQYISWGEFVEVETTNKTYEEVILCPNPSNNETHLLEFYNGDVVEVKTIDLKRITRTNGDTWNLQ